jgi:MFS family permease
MLPIQKHVSARYNTSSHVASLTFSLYLLGSGLGCISIGNWMQRRHSGRNAVFASTAGLFLAVTILITIIDSLPALLTLRFVQGLFGGAQSICSLASIIDVYDPTQHPHSSMIWTAALYIGPSLGILLSSWATAETWRQTLWDAVGVAALGFLLVLLLPETSPSPSSKTLKSNAATKTTDHDDPDPPLFQQSRSCPPSLILSLIAPSLLTATFIALLPTLPALFPSLATPPTQSLAFMLSTTLGAAILLRAAAVFLLDYHIPSTITITSPLFPPNNNSSSAKGWLKPALATIPLAPLSLLLIGLTSTHDPPCHFLVPATAIALFAGAAAVAMHAALSYAFALVGLDSSTQSLSASPSLYPRSARSRGAGREVVRVVATQLGGAVLLGAGLVFAVGFALDGRGGGKIGLGALVGVCAVAVRVEWACCWVGA